VLGEDHSFWGNRWGQVQTNIHKLTHQASQLTEGATRMAFMGKYLPGHSYSDFSTSGNL
jgi:X-X-X-Leu-X-X-Gly heptad repeat protein